MENNRSKPVIAAVILALLGIAATYGYQCLICFMDSFGFKFQTFLVMLLLSGLPMVIIQLLFVAISMNRLQWELKYVCLTHIISSILFGVLLFVLFPLIPVPYELIPAREMAMDFLQLLIGIFAAIPAGIGVLAGLIVLATKCTKTR
ncbi:MAG: hypothetical protein K6B44_03685 [Lachnospiraceae bacterium]|nr:hypothetical protein [Lachnospiraceae bacterium]